MISLPQRPEPAPRDARSMGKPGAAPIVSAQRALFSVDIASLLLYANTTADVRCAFDEVYRPRWISWIYAMTGKGILHSLHTIGLAADLDVWLCGVYQQAPEIYAHLAAHWKASNPLNRWGGDWPSRDYRHYERRPL